MELLLTLLLVLVATADPVVINSGFEQKDERTGMPSGWLFTSIPDRRNLVEYNTRVITTDGQPTNALTISVAVDHPDQNVAYNVHQDLQGLAAGKSYIVSAKVRSEGLSSIPVIVVQCMDGEGKGHLQFARSPEKKLPADLKQWERVETKFTVPDGTSAVRLRIGIPAKGNAGGTAIIDDVAVDEIK